MSKRSVVEVRQKTSDLVENVHRKNEPRVEAHAERKMLKIILDHIKTLETRNATVYHIEQELCTVEDEIAKLETECTDTNMTLLTDYVGELVHDMAKRGVVEVMEKTSKLIQDVHCEKEPYVGALAKKQMLKKTLDRIKQLQNQKAIVSHIAQALRTIEDKIAQLETQCTDTNMTLLMDYVKQLVNEAADNPAKRPKHKH